MLAVRDYSFVCVDPSEFPHISGAYMSHECSGLLYDVVAAFCTADDFGRPRLSRGSGRAFHFPAVAASEATSATTPRRSRGRPSGRRITRLLLRVRPSSSTASGTTRAAPWRRKEELAAGARALA
jgi:hypothetical protein